MRAKLTQPVGSGRHGDTLGTDGKGEDLADDNPGTGTPGSGEEEDVDADKTDHGLHRLVVLGLDGADNRDDELADGHAESTPDEERTTAKTLHGPEGQRSGAHVDQGGNEGDEEWVVNGSELLEESGAEVEDEVDTSPERIKLALFQ